MTLLRQMIGVGFVFWGFWLAGLANEMVPGSLERTVQLHDGLLFMLIGGQIAREGKQGG